MRTRFEVRKAARVPVELVSADWDEPVTLTTSDISPRGCFIRSGVLMERGEPVVVSFRVSETAPEMTLFGEVTRLAFRRRGADLGPPGFGIRFVDVGPMDRIRIRESLRGVPPPLPPVYPPAYA